MLRFCREPHQQQVARLAILDARDALQAGLTVERSLKLTLRRGAAVAGDIEMPGADLAGDVNRDTGAVEPETGDSPLVPKRRAEALPGGSDDVLGRHAPPCPICA